MKKLAACISVFFLAGCGQLHSLDQPRSPIAARYQVVADSVGGAWRLDVITGEMKYCLKSDPVNTSATCYKAIDK